MKKKIALLLIVVMLLTTLTGCASWKRFTVDLKSDFNNGLERTINIYTADGKLLAQYEGKIDLEMTSGGYVKFDLDGKRYIYYNCFVESIADID